MKGTKRLIFWGLTLFFCVSNFIRLFIHDDFGKTVRVYFRDVPAYLKVIFFYRVHTVVLVELSL